jgi:hypothetical protein
MQWSKACLLGMGMLAGIASTPLRALPQLSLPLGALQSASLSGYTAPDFGPPRPGPTDPTQQVASSRERVGPRGARNLG